MSPSGCSCLLLLFLIQLCVALQDPRSGNGLCRLKEGQCLPSNASSLCNLLDVQCEEGSICCKVATDTNVPLSRTSPATCSSGPTAVSAPSGFISVWSAANYENNLECSWIITVDSGNIIHINWNRFDLEGTFPECVFDYVEIYDDGSLLGERFCGSYSYALTSTSNQVLVYFRSDSSVVRKGFQLEYSSFSSSDAWIYLSPGTSVPIKSENYPERYPRNYRHIWYFLTSSDSTISIYCDTFKMLKCKLSKVRITGGDLNEKFCGKRNSVSAASTNNELVVNVRTKGRKTKKGFHCTVSASDVTTTPYYPTTPTTYIDTTMPVPPPITCSGTQYLSGPSGDISFWSTNLYANNLDCWWVITVDSGYSVEITWIQFDLEGSFPGCNFDYVEIYNDDGSLLGQRFCDDDLPYALTSTSNEVWVNFHTDGSVQRQGFVLEYSSVLPSATCSGTQYPFGSSGDISVWSANLYENNLDCWWVITVDSGNTIDIAWSQFDLEGSFPGCPYDYVEIYDNGYLLGQRFCGDDLPYALSSCSNQVSVHFHTDGSVQRQGFVLYYSSVSSSATCSGTQYVSGSSGSLSVCSPNLYENNLDCWWLITGGSGNSISINWNQFELESSSTCSYDYIEIYDNGYLLGERFCGDDLPYSLTTSSNEVWVNFHTDGSVQRQGFVLEYSWGSSATCSGTTYISRNSGSVSVWSAAQYENNLDCDWIITVDSGNAVYINWMQLELEYSSTCGYDYIEIYDSVTGDLLGQRFCGYDLPYALISSSNQVSVYFHTDGSVQRNGFILTYSSV